MKKHKTWTERASTPGVPAKKITEFNYVFGKKNLSIAEKIALIKRASIPQDVMLTALIGLLEHVHDATLNRVEVKKGQFSVTYAVEPLEETL